MKSLSIILLLILSYLHSFCQDQQPNNAIIHLAIETITQEDNTTTSQNDNQFSMRMMNGEIKTTIWIKDNKSKTDADMGFGKSVIYYDGKTKTTTTLFEMMGKKMGFYTNEEEMNKMISQNDSSRVQNRNASSEDIQIEYLSETKTIADKLCKKAIIHYKNSNQEAQTQEVWYYPGYKLDKEISLNAVIRSAFVPGVNKLKGFPMEMEIQRKNGTITKYIVNKIETEQILEDALFNIPSGYDIRPMSEMNQGGRGRFQFKVEND
jgi:hypothetical protein